MENKKGNMLTVMLGLAAAAHAGQYDKAGEPYILHPLTVMQNLVTKDEELQCIALGHDLIEDTFVTETHLRSYGFSERIIDGILGLTKKKGQSYKEYQAEVLKTTDRMRVKRQDLMHNTNLTRLSSVGIPITDKIMERQMRYVEFIDLINEHLN